MHTDSTPWGRLASASDEQAQRKAAIQDPGEYHGNIAARELHWYDGNDWLSFVSQGHWQGLGIASGAPVNSPRADDWRPWTQAFDDSCAPFYRWYRGASTNACFNEIDRHVLAGRGEATAIIFEGDRWDPSRNNGKGGPVQEVTVSFRRLLAETVLRAQVLSSLGLKRGDRIAFN
ncbi:MAG: hypothetical protein NWQ45_11420, partial [Congregibacter sp.]|nr:hypothetical protein [Congregibacter sp.]